MKETSFINQNKKKWAKFEKMSKTQQNDPDEMSQLFVEITDDLSFARTHYPKRSVRVYLNSLAQRVFHDLYKKKREPFSKFIKFWTTDLPLEMYRARKNLLVAFLIFAIGMLIGIVSTYDNEDFLGSVIGDGYVAMAEQNIADGKPMNVYGHGPESLSFGNIAINNMRVAFMTFVLGFFFSLGSGIFLFFNAIMVGAFQWFYVVRGLTMASFLTIWIHGAFEIPAIILAAAAGITMGNGLLFPGTLTRLQSLIISAKRGVKMMIGIVPFILLAAFIEGYATRHTVITIEGDPLESEWPNSLKWLFIMLCFAIVLFYFVIYPFILARKQNFDGKVSENPQYKSKKEIDFYKIKDVGEIFSDTFMSYAKLLGSYLKLFLITTPLNLIYVYLLFDRVQYYHYSHVAEGFGLPFMTRAEKIIENLEVLFTWNEYFSWDLFLFQTFIFTINTYSVIYLFRTMVRKNLEPSIRSYFKLLLRAIIPIFIAFLILGMISVKAPFGLMIFIGLLSPLLFMWFIPITVRKDMKFGEALQKGFSIPFKAFMSGVGLFGALLITLFIIYSFVALPIDIFKDIALEWFVLPIAENPQYVFIIVDASIYILLCHLIFPIFIIGFIMMFYSTSEKEEATGMFLKLKKFGKESKVYESADEGEYW